MPIRVDKKIPDRELMLFAGFLLDTDCELFVGGKSLIGDLLPYHLYKELRNIREGIAYSPKKADELNVFLKKHSNTIGFHWQAWKKDKEL